MFSGLLTYIIVQLSMDSLVAISLSGNVKCDVSPCHFTVGDNLYFIAHGLYFT